MSDEGEPWIFAYGSLMWRPDFPFLSHHKARLTGYHRALCIFSHHYRGTPAHPGLVLGLDRGGSCVGLAFRIASDLADTTLAAVRERELISGVYREKRAVVTLDTGLRQEVVTFVADRDHRQYAGKLSREAIVAHVRTSIGAAGPNTDYVRNTARHLRAIGCADPRLDAVVASLGMP